jgi:aryl-phospho-beta-D-glucosidase BglC (GH1 family)
MKKLEGYMKGVNLGGWLSQYNDTTKEYYDTFIVEDDIDRIKNAGFDHVRIPVDYDILEDEAGNPKEGGYMYLDKCISWCK